MVLDLDVDEIGGAYRVGAVFRPNADGRGWYSLRNLTGSQFAPSGRSCRDRGFRLVDQEVYVAGGKDRFAGVWIENREQLAVGVVPRRHRGAVRREVRPVPRRRLPAGRHRRLPHGLRRAALRRRVGEERRRARLEAASQPHLRRSTRRAFNTYAGQGLRSIVVDSARTSDGQRYAGIWIENRSHRGWYAYRDMTATGFRNQLEPPRRTWATASTATRSTTRPRARATPASGARTPTARTGRCAQGRRLRPEGARRLRRARHQRHGVDRTARSSTAAASATRTRPTASGCTAARSTAPRR